MTVRLDTTEDVEYWRHGGILPRVWRSYVNGEPPRAATSGARPPEPEPDGSDRELPDAVPASDMPAGTQGASLT